MKGLSIQVFTVLVLLSMLIGCTAQPVTTQPTALAESTDQPAGPGEEATVASEPADEPVVDEEVVLTIAQQTDAYSMDPTQHTQKPTASILFAIYDPLVIRDADGQVGPGLALSWELVEDTRWRFKLREGVSFTNGEPMDADAVVYTINRAIDPETASPYLSRVESIDRAEKIDTYTVDIVTKQPDPILLSRLDQMSYPMLIVPPQQTAANGDRVPDDNPVGTGPFKFVEWVKDDHVTLEANADYWGGTPEIDMVIWRPIPEASARISALKNNEVQIIVNVPPELAASIEEDPNTKILSIASDYVYYINFDSEGVEPFKDKLVRQALNYAVDAETINNSIMMGYGKPIAISYATNGFAYPSDLEPYPYDPEKAKQLLAEAGYPDGFGPVLLNSRNGRYLKDTEIVEAVAQYLEKVGVDVEVQFVEGGVWGDLGNAHNRGDMSFPGWSGLDPDLVWYPLLHCGEFQSYYCNPDLDALLEQARGIMDEAERAEIYAQAAAMIKDEAPHIPLFQPPLIFGAAEGLQWQPSIDDTINLRGAVLTP